MKTPEEIKKGLECCLDDCDRVGNCPYSGTFGCDECLKRDALAYIEKLEAQIPRWIPVEERLPDKCEFVLCIVRYGEDAWNHELGFVLNNKWVHPGRIDGTVTHWMPLPEPPTKEDKK